MKLRFFSCSATLIVALLVANPSFTDAQVGVCFGRFGNNLPSASETVELFKQKNIQKMRLYSPDQDVLTALRGSNIEVMLGLPNPDLQRVATSQPEADTWVRDHVIAFADSVKFRYVSVGNEVKITDPFAQFLGPALENIDRAISAAGLGGRIQVSTAVDMGVLAESSPPSKGAFRGDVMVLMDPIIRFLVSKKSPLHLNMYPFFSVLYNSDIPLGFALFEGPTGSVSDPPNSYQNLFEAMLDAVYSALEKSGGGSLEIVVSETGWPTDGGGALTNVENARKYNNNLMQRVKSGTPKRPGKAIETYVFAMYDENGKSPEYEKFWGLFHPDKQPKYDVNFN